MTILLLTLNYFFMNKFITVTAYETQYSFNVSHIICVSKSNDGKAVIYHTTWGNNTNILYVEETYDYVINMINH